MTVPVQLKVGMHPYVHISAPQFSLSIVLFSLRIPLQCKRISRRLIYNFLRLEGNLEKSVSPWQTRAFALLRLPSTAAQSSKLNTSGKHDCVYSLVIFQFVLYLCTVCYCQKCNAENKGFMFLNSRRLLAKLKSHTIALFCTIAYNYRGSMVVHA